MYEEDVNILYPTSRINPPKTKNAAILPKMIKRVLFFILIKDKIIYQYDIPKKIPTQYGNN